MASKPSSNSSQKHIDDKMVVIDIHQKLKNLPSNQQNPHRVCISRVSKSLSCTKPESFIPQFVGLGPYHHFRRELTMTDEMKLGVANRVPKVKDLIPHNGDMFQKYLTNYVSDIQSLYHTDVCYTYDSHTLLYLLTVDGLFLLGLIHSSNYGRHLSHYYYIITERKHEHGMPLINPAGEELTTDGVIGDVFVLENQIPTLVLKHLNRLNTNSNNEIQLRDQDLGLAMQNFCQLFSPFVHSENLSSNLESHDHLLDLMYHLVAPEFKPEPKVEPKPKPGLWARTRVCFSLLGIYFECVWAFYDQLIFSLLGSLAGIVKWVLILSSGTLVNMPSLTKRIDDRIDIMHRTQTQSRDDARKLDAQIYEQIKERRHIGRLIQQRRSTDSLMKPPTIPSAIELNSVEVRFQPAEGGISFFKFDNETGHFYLPSLRLDANFEVIVRNLLAYESLTKSNGLIFTRYIELMSALILSSEDVKLLIDENIIQTSLSHQVVAQIFTGIMTKLTVVGPTKIRKLEEEIKKVNVVYKNILYRRLFWPNILRVLVILMATVAVYTQRLIHF